MRVLRAHDYRPIEAIRHELGCMPYHWRDAIAHVSWIVLPDDLSPLWMGLLRRETETSDGRPYSRCGGWYADERHAFWVRDTPHIYLDHQSAQGSAIHEAGHALARAWRVPLGNWFRPARALYPYMALDEEEYFACAVDAFLTVERADHLWNCHDLAKRDPDIHTFLVTCYSTPD